DVLHRRFVGSGRVTFMGGCDHRSDGTSHRVTSLVSGETTEIEAGRVVDATYLSPTVPATTPPPFEVDGDVPVVAINEPARLTTAPTLGAWELDLLRSIERVVRYGRVRRVDRREIVLDHGSVPMDRGALVVHCAASGLAYPPMVPVWGPDRIRLQTIRAGFPCF